MFGSRKREGALVLVHGAWVGEWSWLPIEAELRASGRAFYPISLTGHGAKRHLGGPHITLADHVDDVVGFVETMDLAEITLVGHSYGGRVISQAWARLRDRVAHMVYLDAHTPVADDQEQPPSRVALAAEHDGMLPFPDRYLPPPDMIGGRAGVEWFQERTAMQSFATLTAPWQADLPADLAKTFVYAAGDPESRFQVYADICGRDPDWIYHEITGHHFLMMSHPTDVARILLDS